MLILLVVEMRKNQVVCHIHDPTAEYMLPFEVLYVILCHVMGVLTGQGGARFLVSFSKQGGACG